LVEALVGLLKEDMHQEDAADVLALMEPWSNGT
jgi:hypothetical protein